MKLNNNGQILIMFVLILPVLVLLIGVVLNKSVLTYEKNKLDNINNLVIEEYIDEETIYTGEVIDYILKNDNSIVIDKIDIKDDYVSIKMTKNINSFFAGIIGEEHFTVVSEIKKKR